MWGQTFQDKFIGGGCSSELGQLDTEDLFCLAKNEATDFYKQ